MINDKFYGTDYNNNGEVSSKGDISLINGRDNALESIKTRLITPLNFYPYLSDYGSQIHEIIGEPWNNELIQLFELFIKNTLKFEPRVKDVVNIKTQINEDKITTQIEIKLNNTSDDEIKLII